MIVTPSPNPLPASLALGEQNSTHCTGVRVGPVTGLDGCEKSNPFRDLIPGLSSPYQVTILTTQFWSTICLCVTVNVH
jgi:hypothetical protein